MISISVFVCTYNPRADLLLEVLVNVGESTKVACEDVIVDSLVVVDNNSKSESSEMIKRLCENHGFDYVLETKQGLTHARLCASQNKSDWLLFVDDDNILAPDFIRQLGRIIEERPNIGALSGQVRITKSDCNAWQNRYKGLLVHRELDKDCWGNELFNGCITPCGAGLAVHKSVAAKYLQYHEDGQRPLILDRSGHSLLSGGDNDLAYCAIPCGFGMGVFESLKISHVIAEPRFKLSYMLNLAKGISASRVVLESYWNERITSWKRLMFNLMMSICRLDWCGALFNFYVLLGWFRGRALVKKYV